MGTKPESGYAGRLGELGRGGFALVTMTARDDDLGAGVGKPEGHGATQAAAAAGDDGDLAGQVGEEGVARHTGSCRSVVSDYLTDSNSSLW
ncbi:MAG: hypothetical protein BWY91_03318 [bacterium ADurb.BinA028]|nr:MAG: hypothetical protein BWY91_03318 [bacterium ADurb.BinA028]